MNKSIDGFQNEIAQKFDNLQYSISRLINQQQVQENGKFPSQTQQNPKGIHQVASTSEAAPKMDEVKAIITMRSGKKVDQSMPKPLDEAKEGQDEELEKILIKEDMMKKSMPPPFPQAVKGKKWVNNPTDIFEVLRQVKVNIPLLDMIKQVPSYAKFIKDLCIVKKGLNVNKTAFLIEHESFIIQCKTPLKYKDRGSPTISVNIGGTCVERALLDLRASVNLLPYLVYKQLGLGELKPTTITLSLTDRSIKIPKGIVEDVLVKVDKFYYPVDFVVLDTEPMATRSNYVPIILGRPFLATSNAIINYRNGVMQLTFGNMTLELKIFHLSNKHEPPEEQEPEEVYLIGISEGEHYARKLQGELKESLEKVDEELSTPPITPAAPPFPSAPLDNT